jgi:hypothetical protein
MLGEPQCIAIGIVHVKLARAPTLINWTFMDFLRSLRIPERTQPSLPKLPEERVNVIGRNDNHLPEFPVATVAGEKQTIPVTRQRAEGRICEIVIALDALEIEDAGVERQRRFHVSTVDCCEDGHMPPNLLLDGDFFNKHFLLKEAFSKQAVYLKWRQRAHSSW